MLTSGFFNGELIGLDEQGAIYDRSYNSEFYARYFSSFISNGVFNKDPNSFQVVANTGKKIIVKSGECFINGYFGFNNEHEELEIEQNRETNPRIDRIVLSLNLSTRDITIKILKGESAEEPQPKELTRSGDIFEIALADIQVINNIENITNENITDLRENNDLCGIVKNTLGDINKEKLFYEITQDIRKNKRIEKENFNKWFNNLKKLLDTNTVTKHIIQNPFEELGVHNFRYNLNKKKFEKYNKDTEQFEELKSIGKTEITLDKTPLININSYLDKITINWKDASDVIINKQILKTWKGTILVKKEGSPPLAYDDGEILVNNIERNKYLNIPYEDTNLEKGKIYYYGLFPYDEEEIFNTNIQNIVKTELSTEILEDVVYSMIIDTNESDPYRNITYGDDAEKYTTPESWDKSILFKNIRPCIVKNGIVQYYLNQNDYELKENGEPSKLDGTDGEVMIEFPTIFYKMERIEGEKYGKYKLTIVCNYDKYINDNNFTKEHLNYKHRTYGKKLYHSAYLCTLKDNELLSIISEMYTTDRPHNIVEKIRNKNNTSYLASIYTFNLLIILTILRFKTTYLADVFNLDTYEYLGYEEKYKLGSLTKGGLFSGCGNKKPQQAVKVCGIEFECAGYRRYTQTIRTYMSCVGMRNYRNYYEKYMTIFYISPQFVSNGDVGNIVYPNNQNIIFKEEREDIMASYFNDFLINPNIGFFPVRNAGKPNSTDTTYLTFSGRSVGGDYSILNYNLFAKNDNGSNIRPSDGNPANTGNFSAHYIYIPPNEENK